MKSIFKKLTIPKPVLTVLFLFLFLLFTASIVSYFRFQRFTKTLFQEEMKRDTLSMHYTLANPEAYGIPQDHVALLPYSGKNETLQKHRVEDYCKTANTILPLFPDKDSRLLLQLLQQQLSSREAEAEFSYYSEPLSPGSGIIANLPILLAEYTFRSEQDVKNYLTLLSQIPNYLKGIALYEKEKAKAGLFMSDCTADKIIRQCYEIMDSQKLLNDTHFLNTTFSERVQTLVGKKLLTPEQAAHYQQQNHLLLFEQLMPAYEALGDEILSLKGNGKNPYGLSYLPKGKAYYSFLLKETTGSSRSITDLKQLLNAQIKKDAAALSLLLKECPSLLSAPLKAEFPQMSSEEYLSDLQMRIAEDFPPFPQTGMTPSHTVKKVSESLQEYCSPAFYLTPPIDDISENSIYINEKDQSDALELYTTLAHEGYPGHLYQTVYHQLYQQQENISPSRNLLHYGGYSEGWALYVEMQSYEYAKELLQEHGASKETLLLADAIRLNRSIQLCLYTLLDISIHYDGATPETVTEYLRNFGITEPSVAKDIYEYIVQEPANYPKYYVGYLEFLMLKDTAKQQWKDSYSDMRFHRMILETGPCPFSVFWKQLS